MHLRPWQSLILILIITFGAVWVALPGDDFDFGNFRADHEIRQGLDLQGGLQVVLEADPPAGTKIDSATMNGTPRYGRAPCQRTRCQRAAHSDAWQQSDHR